MTICWFRPLPMIEAAVPANRTFSVSADGFVSRLKAEEPRGIWDAATLWELYSDHFADYANLTCHPLTRGQFFRHLGAAGVRRFRAGGKDVRGKRPYLYRLPSPGRPPKRRGRIDDARPQSVSA